MKSDTYMPFWGWLILCGLMGFGGFLLWHYGLWHSMLEQDHTYLSGIILLLFLATTLYLGRSAWYLASETRTSHTLSQQLHTNVVKHNQQPQSSISNSSTPTSGWAYQHLDLLLQLQQNSSIQAQSDTLQARLIEQVHGGHQSGWFMADLLLRLGLVGTVIGFVLMLGAVYGLEEDGISALKQLLTSMGGGMQVALYTTLTGLGAATLLSIQCHWLDRCADRLVSRIIEMGVTDLAVFTALAKQNDTLQQSGTEPS
ncbi:MAG: MotA/TolQ/ExbB proton channel family protein [Thiolinea sp.]